MRSWRARKDASTRCMNSRLERVSTSITKRTVGMNHSLPLSDVVKGPVDLMKAKVHGHDGRETRVDTRIGLVKMVMKYRQEVE